MLFINFYNEIIKYNNENITKIPHEKIFFYDKENVIKCPNCNNIIIFIVNNYYHKCLIKEEESFEINKNITKNLLCNMNKIENKCAKHNCEFLYYKELNYYCSSCLKEKKIKNFLVLDEIVLSEEEINNFKILINDCENILLKSKKIYKNLINSNDDDYIKFENRNKLLIEYCKNLLKLNENFEKNYNLISTIRRISINIDLNKMKKKSKKELIDFYRNDNIIKFNCEYDDYFTSENILQNGKYYLGKTINKGSFGEILEALLIKDKKLVAIKILHAIDKDKYFNEVEIIKDMSECEYSIKYIDSFEEKNNMFIVTELCDSNLRNEIKNKKNGFSIEYIKKIFSQINEGLKFLINSKKIIHRDLKPDNILINKIKRNDNSIYYKFKLCDYGFSKYFDEKFLESNVGTEIYEAPEINNNKYTTLSDLFSIGIILYEFYYGNLKISKEQILNNIKKGLKIKNENDDINEFINLKNLIKECTNEEEKRINWNDYFNHSFFYYEIEIIININLEDLNNNIKLIGFDNFNENNTELFIDNKKILFRKEYKFTKMGQHFIKFKFNNNITKSSLENMFNGCKNIIYINFIIFNTSKIKNINNMFYNCYNLKEIDLSSFDTKNVNEMNNLFFNCYNLKKINLSSFDISNVNEMDDMFSNCYSLSEINLPSFNTKNIEFEIMKNNLSIKDKKLNELNKLFINQNNQFKREINYYKNLKNKNNSNEFIFLNNKDKNNCFYDIIININSFLNLNREGCLIEYGKKGREYYNLNKNIPRLVIGVIGNKETGKSFFLEKISNFNIPHGFKTKTEGLSIKYGELYDNNLLIIDSGGLDSPFLKNEKSNNNISDKYKDEYDDKFDDEYDDDNKLNIEKENDNVNDFKLCKSFIQNFIVYKSDILIIVVGILTIYEQLLLFEIKNKIKNKKIFVIHNLDKFIKKEQVNDYINNTLKKLYKAKIKEKNFLLFYNEKEYFNKYFIDTNEKIFHFIFVNDFCEISNYYNFPTINFIQNEIEMIKNPQKFPVIEEFSKYLYKLSQEIFQENIQDIFKYTYLDKITDKIYINNIKKLSFYIFYIEDFNFDDIFNENDINPNYSYYIKDNFLKIFIELPGGGLIDDKIEKFQEYYLFNFEGIKYGDKEILNSNYKMLRTIRKKKKFNLKIKISNNKFNLINLVPDDPIYSKGIFEYKYRIKLKDSNFLY